MVEVQKLRRQVLVASNLKVTSQATAVTRAAPKHIRYHVYRPAYRYSPYYYGQTPYYYGPAPYHSDGY